MYQIAAVQDVEVEFTRRVKMNLKQVLIVAMNGIAREQELPKAVALIRARKELENELPSSEWPQIYKAELEIWYERFERN